MMYCERCRRLAEGNVCPECGKACKREARDEDLCFLWAGGQIWADMLSDVLGQEHISCLKQGARGAAMAVLTGLQTETFHVYVPFADYEKSREIADGLFPPAGEAPEEAEDADDDLPPGVEKETEEDE